MIGLGVLATQLNKESYTIGIFAAEAISYKNSIL
jgi:hypothetical protein